MHTSLLAGALAGAAYGVVTGLFLARLRNNPV
jgi:gas vesicle protein